MKKLSVLFLGLSIALPAVCQVPTSSGDRVPSISKFVQPELPEGSHAPSGTYHVVVSLVVDQQGAPPKVRVTKSAGYGFDEKAVAAVQKYTFEPALHNGKPVKVAMNVDVAFVSR